MEGGGRWGLEGGTLGTSASTLFLGREGLVEEGLEELVVCEGEGQAGAPLRVRCT